MGPLKFNLFLILAFSSIYCAQLILSKELPSVITLKVLLVEFQDVKHRNPNYPINLSLPAYTYNDFNNMLFSVDTYYSPNMYSPDSDYVFGSLRDYYLTMSNHNFDIDGKILNNDFDQDNIPDWILLDNTKSYYDQNGMEFRQDAKSMAELQGLNIETNDSTFLLIIYSGQTYRSSHNSLTPQASLKKRLYIMGERFAAGSPYCEERDNPMCGPISKFAHIGIHAHEFGHLLGFEDHDGGKDNKYWGLMSKGCFNGSKFNGACPAPINPYLRYKMGWIEIDSLEENSRVSIKYNIRNPKVYKIQDSESDCYFLIEFRNFNANVKMGENYYNDYNSYHRNITFENGVMVWRKLDGDFVKLIYSGGANCSDSDTHIFPGSCNVNVLSPWSDNRPRKMGYYWVPNTKPSLNCGLEIISINNDSAIVDLYVKDPWLSSPSQPKKVTSLLGEKTALTWEENTEPDLNYYRIYKKKNISEYELYDSSEVNQYEDVHETIDSSSNDRLQVFYKITAVDFNMKESTYSREIYFEVKYNATGFAEKEDDIPKNYTLCQNYPNPFNPSTTIKYQIPEQSLPVGRQVRNDKSFVTLSGVEESFVTLKIYDILGREIATLVNQKQKPGNYNVVWNASNLTSGIYYYKLQVGNYTETKKMILMK